MPPPAEAASGASSSARSGRVGRRMGGRRTNLNPALESPQETALFPALRAVKARTMPQRFDFLVLGGGVAGLSFALKAAEHGSVAVLTKRERGEGNTTYAQGGIASVLAPTDSFEAHIED